MKKYDLSQIMKNAHRTYKYVGKKQGKTFGEVLKSTWSLFKMHAAMAELRARQDAELKKQSDEFVHVKAEAVKYTFEGDVYDRTSKGYLGSQYCGD